MSGRAEGARAQGEDARRGEEPGDPSELSERDRPGMPSGADAWDERSGEWLAEGGETEKSGGEAPSPAAGRMASAASAAADFPGSEAAETAPAAGPAGGPAVGLLGATSPLASKDASEERQRTPVPPPPPVPGTGPTPADARGAVAAVADKVRRTALRRGAVDPVKALLHRHRELCERAVDPLEIAAGLEAHGVTDRTAARFRHRDVFSLAEELYARVPRDNEPRPAPDPPQAPRVRADWVLLTLLPGALGTATVTGVRLTQGQPRFLVALGGVLAVALALRVALGRGPLAAPPGTPARPAAPGTRACTLWLLGYALFGDGLLQAVMTGGPDALPTGAPDGPWPTATAPVLALTLACAPAAWCAHLLAAGARRRLAGSRGLHDFTAAVQPLLLGTFTLFLGAVTALLLLCSTLLHEPAAYPQALTLGALLLLARLLGVHHHRRAPGLVLGVTAAVEVAAPALLLGGRLPGCAFLASPVQALVDACGTAGVPALACGAGALALLVHATHALTRASAHAPAGAPE
ncbi:hypothetical protein [Streptomyces sp. NK08204]|uniref:hypothetical protein n=1 Tax=Streptomyces sp. NK08204 TaxID=2873260 RepID=UPI001CEE064E|nr:hypothetical protein [Streptomyces sp. NK08204]